ncbi:MAG: acetate/propionate family kinase [Rhodocyclaceae bacterium]
MSKAILTVNAGSSSIKFALFPLAKPISQKAFVSGQIDGIGADETKLIAKNQEGEKIVNRTLAGVDGGKVTHDSAFNDLFTWFTETYKEFEIVAVGHRVVHGGELYSKPTLIKPDVMKHLEDFIPLAPLHEPHNIAGIKAVLKLQPNVPQVACFDTAFHRTQPEVAQLFGLPKKITAEGVKRYGFHGLSYEFIVQALPEYSHRANGRVIVCHLGNGASISAVVDKQCVATTLGFSTIDGLVMGTRVGSLDAGVIIHLLRTKNMSVDQLEKMLYKESGLLGVSGISQDMRTLLASDAPEARQAVELFCYRIVREIGSLVAAAGGIDALVFTGGIGENSREIRRNVCEQLQWMGLHINHDANAANEVFISTGRSLIDVLVIPTNEEWMMAKHAQTLLGL